MTARHNPIEPAGSDDNTRGQRPWESPHVLADATPDVKTLRTAGTTTDQVTGPLDVPPVFTPGQDQPQRVSLEIPPIGTQTAGPPEIPAPVQQAIANGTPIRFSSAGENQQANRQPDYFFTPEGQLVPNPKATPSADGSINIQVQSKDATNNKSLRDAITHESDMQKAAAKDMIRLFQKAHPNEPVPGWMNDLASAKPNLPDFVPFPPSPNAPVTAPPENGFVPRGVSGGGGGGGGGSGGGDGGGGFAGNGGFDSGGNFRGSAGSGDGTLSTGGTSSQGQPLGAGETVKAKDIYDYMSQQLQTEMKLSPDQAKIVASGILGNMQTESSFNTKAYNAGEGAIGLAQWEGGRRGALEAFANSPAEQAIAKADGVSNPVLDYKVQVDFMIHELKGSESGAWGHISGAQSPGQAAAAFDQYYERSSGAARGQRVANADNIYTHVANA